MSHKNILITSDRVCFFGKEAVLALACILMKGHNGIVEDLRVDLGNNPARNPGEPLPHKNGQSMAGWANDLTQYKVFPMFRHLHR